MVKTDEQAWNDRKKANERKKCWKQLKLNLIQNINTGYL